MARQIQNSVGQDGRLIHKHGGSNLMLDAGAFDRVKEVLKRTDPAARGVGVRSSTHVSPVASVRPTAASARGEELSLVAGAQYQLL